MPESPTPANSHPLGTLRPQIAQWPGIVPRDHTSLATAPATGAKGHGAVAPSMLRPASRFARLADRAAVVPIGGVRLGVSTRLCAPLPWGTNTWSSSRHRKNPLLAALRTPPHLAYRHRRHSDRGACLHLWRS